MTAVLDSPVTDTTTAPAPVCECPSRNHPRTGSCPNPAKWLIQVWHGGNSNQKYCEKAQILQVCGECRRDLNRAAAMALPSLCAACLAHLTKITDLIVTVAAL